MTYKIACSDLEQIGGTKKDLLGRVCQRQLGEHVEASDHHSAHPGTARANWLVGWHEIGCYEWHNATIM